MANQSGNGRDGYHHWRAGDDQLRGGRRDDEDRYRARDDEERGSSWDDRDRESERYGMGQRGYGAGRTADDRSLGATRNPSAWSGSQYDRDANDRWASRSGASWGSREYGRGGWEQGRMGVAPGYGYSDGDRPSFDRGVNDRGYGGPYGDGGQSGYRQHQTGFGGAQGLDLYQQQPRRGHHRGKGPQGFQRSDERIREMVCEALTDHDDVDATSIEVTVKNGEVALMGIVEDRYMKRLAEDCVERVSGVRDVHNQLRIRDGRT